jgi:hypothetical protein
VLAAMVVVLAIFLSLKFPHTPGLAPGQSRSFRMGFTPWPWAATQEAVDWVHREIRREGDIVGERFEEGVPWAEALSGAPFPQTFQDSLDDHLKRRQAGQQLFLSLNPMNPLRTRLAPSLGAAWDATRFNEDQVKTAYVNYVRRMAALFKPDYLAIGAEVNLLARNDPSQWKDYVELLAHTYKEIKKSYSGVVFVSVEAVALLGPTYSEADEDDQKRALADVLPYCDLLGVSLHPFLSSFLADKIPEELYERIFDFAPGKKTAITEFSYPAQRWSTRMKGATLVFEGTEEKQDAFLGRVLESANSHEAPFVIWLTLRDYDALWESTGRKSDLLVWRDTGLYDERGATRKALHTWRKWFQRPFR